MMSERKVVENTRNQKTRTKPLQDHTAGRAVSRRNGEGLKRTDFP